MKAILFLSFLFFSSASHSAFIAIWGDSTPFGDSIGGCFDETCYGESSPGYFTENGEIFLHNETVFVQLYTKYFGPSQSALFSWSVIGPNPSKAISISSGLDSYSTTALSGSTWLNLINNQEYYFSVLAFASGIDTEVSWSVTPSAVPLPASIFFLASSLLGLIGIRRKLL